MAKPETLRAHIPLTLRNRGGCPRILPPKEIKAAMKRGQDARLLRAIGRAWTDGANWSAARMNRRAASLARSAIMEVTGSRKTSLPVLTNSPTAFSGT